MQSTTLKIAALVLTLTAFAPAAVVTPGFAGGELDGPMIMPSVYVGDLGDGTQGILITNKGELSTPQLVPLPEGDTFDPAQPWAVLTGKAYNRQYGWNIDANSQNLPTGRMIWIDQTASSSPLLQTYQVSMNMTGAASPGDYTPLFGTAGSSEAWQWNGVMAHNMYAVPEGIAATWWADYTLYVGDAAGNADPAYASDTIRLTWTSVPEPTSLALLAVGALSLRRRRC